MFTTRPVAFPLIAVLALAVAGCGTPEERAAEYTARAQEFWDKGDVDRTAVEARNAIQVEPKNAKARYLLALAAERKGQVEAAINHLAVVIEVDPANAAAKVKLGKYLVNAQDYNGAGLIADEALAIAPDDPEAQLLKARVLVSRDDKAGALEWLDKALATRPDLADAAMLRALTLATDDPEKGLAELTSAIERVGPQDKLALRKLRVDMLSRLQRNDEVEKEVKSLIAEYPKEGLSDSLALFYVAQQRLDDAEKVLRDAVAADPANFRSKVNLAQFQARYRRQPEQAEKTLKEFIAQDPENLQLPVFLGNFYEGTNRPDDARKAYATVAERAPSSVEGVEARNRLVALALQAGDTAAAREQVDAILKDQPDNTAALLTRGEMNFAAGSNEEAVSDLRGVLRREPDNQLALLILARTHIANGDRPLAEDALRRLLQVNPQNVEGMAALAGVLAEGGQLDEADAMFKQAIAANPKDPAVLEGMVGLALARDDLKAAEQSARDLAALDRPDGVGYRELGRVLEAQGKLPAANEAYRKSLAKKPDSTLGLEGVVRTLQGQQKFDEATAYLRGHLEEHPDHVLARVLLGGNLVRTGKFAEAQEVLNQAIDQQPQLVRAYMVLAGSYPNDAAARVAAFERGLAANPKSGALAVLLASEHQRAGRWDDAIALYEKVLKEDDRLPQVANNLAALLLDHRSDADSHKRALEIAKRFANSQQPMYLDTLGWANYRNKDYESAIRYLELAAAFGSKEPEVRYHLAMAYLAVDNKVGAKQELEKALKDVNPAAPWLEDAKKTLAGLASAEPPKAGTGPG